MIREYQPCRNMSFESLGVASREDGRSGHEVGSAGDYDGDTYKRPGIGSQE